MHGRDILKRPPPLPTQKYQHHYNDVKCDVKWASWRPKLPVNRLIVHHLVEANTCNKKPLKFHITAILRGEFIDDGRQSWLTFSDSIYDGVTVFYTQYIVLLVLYEQWSKKPGL